MASSEALNNYRQLLAKVDAKFAEIQARHAAKMQCGRGCHGCCAPGLSVSAVETASIRAALAGDPALARRVAAVSPREDRCAFLEADGACSIYEVRPLVCRSHGVPVAFKRKTNGPLERDACPLNFKDGGLAALGEGDQINLELLNTLLTLINRQLAGDQGAVRTPLTPAAMLPERQ